MTKKKPILDAEWNALAKIGEIKSRVNQALDDATTLITELEAKGELARRQESRVIRSGVLEVKSISGSFVASFHDGPPVQVNGHTVPPRIGKQVRGVGVDPYEAVKALAIEMKQSAALG